MKDTLIFNTFVMCQVFNEFNARKLEKKNVIQRNPHQQVVFGNYWCDNFVAGGDGGVFEEVCRYRKD